jgi:hypothetical protein
MARSSLPDLTIRRLQPKHWKGWGTSIGVDQHYFVFHSLVVTNSLTLSTAKRETVICGKSVTDATCNARLQELEVVGWFH